MQADDNDIIVSSHSFDVNIFKVLYESFSGSTLSYDSVTAWVLHLWTIYSIFAFAVSALFIAGIIYAYIRASEFYAIEHQNLHDQEQRWHELNNGEVGNERWHSVQHHMESNNPNDWKLAIIEADVLLEHMLDEAGYAGATIAEKLKSASVGSFHSIDDAWQAHRVRNQIAHGGADFVLTQKVAKETLIQYERVFREFNVLEGDQAHGGGHH